MSGRSVVGRGQRCGCPRACAALLSAYCLQQLGPQQSLLQNLMRTDAENSPYACMAYRKAFEEKQPFFTTEEYMMGQNPVCVRRVERPSVISPTSEVCSSKFNTREFYSGNHCGKPSVKNALQDFPGCAVVRDPPANAGHTGSSPGPGTSHLPVSNEAPVPQLLSLRSRTQEPQLTQPNK